MEKLTCLSVLGVAMLAGSVSAQGVHDRYAALPGAAVHAESGVHVLSFVKSSDSAGPLGFELRLRLLDDDPSTTERPAALLWSGDVLAPGWDSRASFVPLQSGGWLLGTALSGGGTRFLLGWTSRTKITETTATDTTRFEVSKVVLDNVLRSGSQERAELSDLFAPEFFESVGKPWVVAVGFGDPAPRVLGNQLVWVADLEARLEPAGPDETVEQLALAGHAIAKGSDPRVVRSGDSWLVALRDVRIGQDVFETASLAFYRSRDLSTWVRDAELSDKLKVPANYALHARGEQIWIASTESHIDGPLQVQVFQPGRGFAPLAQGARRTARASSPLAFLTSADSTEPMVAYRDADGRTHVTRP